MDDNAQTSQQKRPVLNKITPINSYDRRDENNQEGLTLAPLEREDELPDVLEALSRGEPVYALTERKRAKAASRRNLAFTAERIAEIVLAPPGEEMFAQALESVLDVTRSEWGALGYLAAGASGHPMVRLGGRRKWFRKSVRPAAEQQEGYLGEALREKRLVCSNQPENVVEDDVLIRRIMVAPLLDRDETIGYIEIGNKEDDYDESDRAFLGGMAKSLGPVLCALARRDAHESELSAALASKEVLLQELHHCVKNNLQIISSLLSLQAESLPAEGRKALDESQRRVRSMALIHEQLYSNTNLGRLDFGEYAQGLCTELFGAFGVASDKVQLRFDLDPVALDMNQATPCGLILNEIVTNSLKYAFPDSRRGEILVALHGGADNVVSLRMADNGIGLPPGFRWQESKSLGLRIVDILARQLGGSLREEPGAGADFTLTFMKRDG
jgi:two-component sensor histidine kinase